MLEYFLPLGALLTGSIVTLALLLLADRDSARSRFQGWLDRAADRTEAAGRTSQTGGQPPPTEGMPR
jgi:hypothetical protein